MLLYQFNETTSTFIMYTLLSFLLAVSLLQRLQHRNAVAGAAARSRAAVIAQQQSEVQAAARARRVRQDAEDPSKEITSLEIAITELKPLFADYKYIEAGERLGHIRAAIASGEHSRQETQAAQKQLESLLSGELAQLEPRVQTCREALAALNDREGDWEAVRQTSDMQMYQQWKDTTTLSVKIEAVLGPHPPVKTADTLMIWREAQLYKDWFPMMTAGSKLHEFHPAEVAIHLVHSSHIMLADLVLHGWGVDDLSRSGSFLMCVRPARQKDMPPEVELPPHPSTRKGGGLFPPTRAIAVIDILVEPLSESSVRFAFQITQKFPRLPRWAIQILLHKAMANIFGGLQKAAVDISTNPASPHAKLAADPCYAETATWLRRRIDPFLQRGQVH